VGIDLRYWNSEGYIAPRGMALFQAVSQKYPGLIEKHRELLIVSFIYDKEIFPNVYFDFRILPYKDFVEKITSGTGLEYSFEMYIKYELKVNIKKIKNSFRN
jgi:RNase adaptor protein for sRNA GlmZ degradation